MHLRLLSQRAVETPPRLRAKRVAFNGAAERPYLARRQALARLCGAFAGVAGLSGFDGFCGLSSMVLELA